ncbi:hypothetical protein ATANTOWER_011597 [Ataeniobius toweri]|uniref:Uncharacterized protein n=1 Tax=Ataeniobius toweri TaxID=208326 RepID=A0ABU7A647_9TELE|nr:hypothetical protein [Ataeniobius toweri]
MEESTFSTLHLIHVCGMAQLYLFSFSGVIYVLISQLYCSNFRCVLVVSACAFLHASCHSSNEISVSKFPLQASSLVTDVYSVYTQKPFQKMFISFSSSGMDFSMFLRNMTTSSPKRAKQCSCCPIGIPEIFGFVLIAIASGSITKRNSSGDNGSTCWQPLCIYISLEMLRLVIISVCSGIMESEFETFFLGCQPGLSSDIFILQSKTPHKGKKAKTCSSPET